MKFGVFYAYWTNEWKGDYFHFTKKVKEIGFDILEISPTPLLDMSDKELGELKALSKDLGITLTSNVGPPKDKDISSADPAVRRKGIEFLTDLMKAMDKVDSRSIAGALYSHWPCDFTDLDKEAIWSRAVVSTGELCKTAESLGIDFCLEVLNRFETNVLNTSEEAVRFCKDVGNKACKVMLDTFHMNIEEDNIAEAIRYAGEYLGHVHVGEGNRKLPGKGSLPWSDIGKALRDINFTKGVVMEPFVMEGGQIGKDIKVWRDLSGGASPEKLDQDIRESLIFLKKAFLG
ncbi:MAG: sugar phosphate isomerase/epimerase [Synergistaceae bacterium]|nr:sugar phosphate isomerase/epimerase [Synergistaceae bacterium]